MDCLLAFFVDPKTEKYKQIRKCKAKPGNVHNHEGLSQEMLEFAVIRWQCLLRIVSHRSKETKLQAIESVLSSWPHKISFTSADLETKLAPSLNFYWNRAKNKEFDQNILDQFGEEQFAHFRQVVLQFRSAPVPPGQFFCNFLLLLQKLTNLLIHSSFPTNCNQELSFASTEGTCNG